VSAAPAVPEVVGRPRFPAFVLQAMIYYGGMHCPTGDPTRGFFRFEWYPSRCNSPKDPWPVTHSSLSWQTQLLGLEIAAEKGLRCNPLGPLDKHSWIVVLVHTGPVQFLIVVSIIPAFPPAWHFFVIPIPGDSRQRIWQQQCFL